MDDVDPSLNVQEEEDQTTSQEMMHNENEETEVQERVEHQEQELHDDMDEMDVDEEEVSVVPDSREVGSDGAASQDRRTPSPLPLTVAPGAPPSTSSQSSGSPRASLFARTTTASDASYASHAPAGRRFSHAPSSVFQQPPLPPTSPNGQQMLPGAAGGGEQHFVPRQSYIAAASSFLEATPRQSMVATRQPSLLISSALADAQHIVADQLKRVSVYNPRHSVVDPSQAHRAHPRHPHSHLSTGDAAVGSDASPGITAALAIAAFDEPDPSAQQHGFQSNATGGKTGGRQQTRLSRAATAETYPAPGSKANHNFSSSASFSSATNDADTTPRPFPPSASNANSVVNTTRDRIFSRVNAKTGRTGNTFTTSLPASSRHGRSLSSQQKKNTMNEGEKGEGGSSIMEGGVDGDGGKRTSKANARQRRPRTPLITEEQRNAILITCFGPGTTRFVKDIAPSGSSASSSKNAGGGGGGGGGSSKNNHRSPGGGTSASSNANYGSQSYNGSAVGTGRSAVTALRGNGGSSESEYATNRGRQGGRAVILASEKNAPQFHLSIEALQHGCIGAFMQFFTLAHRDPPCVDALSQRCFVIPDATLDWVQQLLIDIEMRSRSSDYQGVVSSSLQLAEYFESELDVEQAEVYYTSALACAEKSLLAHLTSIVLLSNARFYERQSKLLKAATHYEGLLRTMEAATEEAAAAGADSSSSSSMNEEVDMLRQQARAGLIRCYQQLGEACTSQSSSSGTTGGSAAGVVAATTTRSAAAGGVSADGASSSPVSSTQLQKARDYFSKAVRVALDGNGKSTAAGGGDGSDRMGSSCVASAADLAISGGNEDDAAAAAMAFKALGKVSLMMGQKERALGYQQDYHRIAHELHDKELEYHAAIHVAELEEQLKKTDSAVQTLKSALKLATELNDYEGMCRATLQLGQVLKDMGHYEEAVEYFRNALNISIEREQSETEQRGKGNSNTTATTVDNRRDGKSVESIRELEDKSRIAIGFALGERYFEEAGEKRGFLDVVCNDIHAQLQWMTASIL